jgi:antitoxin HigA-1
MKKRKPVHPGIILEEDYIKPLRLSLQMVADILGISRKTLHKIRIGAGKITPEMALRLSKVFNTTPELWLNLQNKYELWLAEEKHPEINALEAIA